MPVVEVTFVAHGHAYAQSLLQMPVEIHRMGIHVIEQSARRVEPERHGETAAEGLHQPTPGPGTPQGLEAGGEPALAACPFERWAQGGRALAGSRHRGT